MAKKINVTGTEITVVTRDDGQDFISLTDMLKAKDGDYFISDWLRNRNTIEFLGIWEKVYNPGFNYGEFDVIKSRAGLNSYRLSVKEWVEKTGAIGLRAACLSLQHGKPQCGVDQTGTVAKGSTRETERGSD